MNTYSRWVGGCGGSTNGDSGLRHAISFWQFKMGDGGSELLEEGDGDG